VIEATRADVIQHRHGALRRARKRRSVALPATRWPSGAGGRHDGVLLRAGLKGPLRLVVAALPPQARAAAERQDRQAHAPARSPAEQVPHRHRGRWQVEPGFKPLKSLGGLDILRASL
jgi:hypothetical protein